MMYIKDFESLFNSPATLLENRKNSFTKVFKGAIDVEPARMQEICNGTKKLLKIRLIFSLYNNKQLVASLSFYLIN
jgi:hypothetical protein